MEVEGERILTNKFDFYEDAKSYYDNLEKMEGHSYELSMYKITKEVFLFDKTEVIKGE